MVPSAVGIGWEEAEPRQVAAIKGEVHGALGVGPKGDGRSYLHVLSTAGDRMFLYDREARKLKDVTGKLGLGSRSVAAAWGDFNGDGRIDLASWDGERLTTWLQNKRATFDAKPSGAGLSECIGLAICGVGRTMKAGLLASTTGVPVLLAPKGDGTFTAKPIADAHKGGKLGTPHACLVADFDGDAVPDVLQPFEKGAIFFRGTSPGRFDDGKALENLGTGEGHARINTGDYDHDGRLDVFVAAEEGCQVWHNLGGGAFAEAMEYTGEMKYISQPGARSGMTVDINNDGRQDVFITYMNREPQIFFNRGFLSFGHAHRPIDLQECGLFPPKNVPGKDEVVERKNKGQRAGLVRDLDGDGAQDMAIVLEDGSLWVYWRAVGGADPLCVRAALPPGGPAGPVAVSAVRQGRSLGAWNVVAGTSPSFFGLVQEGPCLVKWRCPGSKPREKEIIVEGGLARYLLKP
ncbi:MAG: VCBS repeat-containing protein [Planctomycetota bacterium]